MTQSDPLKTVKLTVEYNGSGFSGWQEQPGQRTIQRELLQTLKTVTRQEVLELTASGRTDSGVHSRGQVISFKTAADCRNLKKIAYGVSSLMRDELTVLDAILMPDNFNARFSAHIKQYSYRIFKRQTSPILDKDFVWHVPATLNLDLMKNSAAALVGEFDFTSLRSSDCCAKSAVRTIQESELIENGDELIYRVVARSFLKQMVRNIVGTLVALGSSKISGVSILDLIEARDRNKAGMTAPARGLCLDWVRYELD
jgi:tRNA pseudouridine38-40 synthase